VVRAAAVTVPVEDTESVATVVAPEPEPDPDPDPEPEPEPEPEPSPNPHPNPSRTPSSPSGPRPRQQRPRWSTRFPIADGASLWRETEGSTGVVSVLDLGSLGYWRPAAGHDGALTWSPSTGAAVWQARGPLFVVTLEDRLPD
jgi:hypothetical protein